MRPKSTKKNTGFTLVEAVVISAVIGVFLVSLPSSISSMFSHKFAMLQSEKAEMIAQELVWQTYYRVTEGLAVRRVAKKDSITRFDQVWRTEYESNKTYIRGIFKHDIRVYDSEGQIQSDISVFLKGI